MTNTNDKIFIKNIKTKAIIGIYDFEKKHPQKIIISLEMGTDIRKASKKDDIKYALDYDEISKFIDSFVQKSNYELIETLAENIVKQLFYKYELIQDIKLKLEKPKAISYTKQVGVKIFRVRD